MQCAYCMYGQQDHHPETRGLQPAQGRSALPDRILQRSRVARLLAVGHGDRPRPLAPVSHRLAKSPKGRARRRGRRQGGGQATGRQMGEALILETSFLVDLEREQRSGRPGRALEFFEMNEDSRYYVTFTTAGELAAGRSMADRENWEAFLGPLFLLASTPDVSW